MITSQAREASFGIGIGRPISPRLLAVGELILTVSIRIYAQDLREPIDKVISALAVASRTT